MRRSGIERNKETKKERNKETKKQRNKETKRETKREVKKERTGGGGGEGKVGNGARRRGLEIKI